MNEPIISVSGLRGIIGQSLTPIQASRYVGAFLSTLNDPGPIVITRDGRVSGEMFGKVIGATVQACGFDVWYGDVAATPTTGVLVRSLKAVGGIQISASHNPPEYNGIKLFGADGRVIPAPAGNQVVEAYRHNQANYASVAKLGSWQNVNDTIGRHLQLVLNTVDRAAIQARKFRVVLDSNHGAGSVLGRALLMELGCQYEILGDTPDGDFTHPPEPTATNLQGVRDKARQFQADVVFCQDPDADRLAIIDEQGTYLGEEYTLALTLDHRLSRLDFSNATIVTNCSSSRMSADIAARYDVKFQMSAVGEANVTDLMQATGAIYGGEGNGGPIDPRVGYVRDSFAAMAQVLDLMAKRNLAISQLAQALPKYEIHKTTMTIDRDKIPALLQKLKREFASATPSELDGLRLDWPDQWLLVRGSNTEPIVRAIAEAKDVAIARDLCERTAMLASQLAEGST